MDSTIPGYLPEEFQELSVTFHKIVERELKLLMDGFVWEDNNERI